MTKAPTVDPGLLQLIETARAAGLDTQKIVKRGRELSIEVKPKGEAESQDIHARIERMVGNAQ